MLSHWPDRVVPVAVEIVRSEIDLGHLFIGHLDPVRVGSLVDLGAYSETGLSGRSGNEINGCSQADQGLASPSS